MAEILQAEDIAAIDRYIANAEIKTPAGQAAREAWINWHDGTTLLDRYLDRATYDRARNLRLAFELANASTEAERAQIMHRALTGVSTEQIDGGTDRRNSQGRYSERAPMTTAARATLWALGTLGVLSLAKRMLLR